MTEEEHLAQWRKWLESITGEVMYMLHSRRIYTEVWQIIEANKGIRGPNAFYAWLNTVYAAYAAAAVRRQLDKDTRCVSMARLLMEIRQHPCAVTRARYVGLFSTHLRKAADEQFGRCFAGTGHSHLDPGVPERDFQQLQDAAGKVGTFVNKKIAHADLEGEGASATWGELNRCIDLLEGLVRKYHNLLTGDAYLTLLPMMWASWKRVFKQPWIPPAKPVATADTCRAPATGHGDRRNA